MAFIGVENIVILIKAEFHSGSFNFKIDNNLLTLLNLWRLHAEMLDLLEEDGEEEEEGERKMKKNPTFL